MNSVFLSSEYSAYYFPLLDGSSISCFLIMFLHHVNALYMKYLILCNIVQIHEVQSPLLDELYIFSIQKSSMLLIYSWDILYLLSRLSMPWNDSMMSDHLAIKIKCELLLKQWHVDHCVLHFCQFSLVLGHFRLNLWQHQFHGVIDVNYRVITLFSS